MSTVFNSKLIPTFTKEQKKVKRLSVKINSRRREAEKPGPVVVVYSNVKVA